MTHEQHVPLTHLARKEMLRAAYGCDEALATQLAVGFACLPDSTLEAHVRLVAERREAEERRRAS